MNYITKSSLIDALKNIGIQSGDTVMVHSDIAAFGTTENFSRKDTLNLFYDAFMEVVGNNGTLCTPAFFYEYARYGIPFDIALSPVSKELGVFAKYINLIPERKRSCNPLTSVCAIGKNAGYICEHINRHAYGDNSAFDRLYKLNAKIVSLGVYGAFTINHLAEYQAGVPYLYNKIYNIPIFDNGKIIFENSIGFVKYLDYNIEYKGQVDKNFAKQTWTNKHFVKKTAYISSDIYAINVQDSINYFKEKLYANPYYLLTKAPNFIEGIVPNDGPVIKKINPKLEQHI